MDYQKQTVVILRGILKERGISFTGLTRKQQLIDRLIEADSEITESSGLHSSPLQAETAEAQESVDKQADEDVNASNSCSNSSDTHIPCESVAVIDSSAVTVNTTFVPVTSTCEEDGVRSNNVERVAQDDGLIKSDDFSGRVAAREVLNESPVQIENVPSSNASDDDNDKGNISTEAHSTESDEPVKPSDETTGSHANTDNEVEVGAETDPELDEPPPPLQQVNQVNVASVEGLVKETSRQSSSDGSDDGLKRKRQNATSSPTDGACNAAFSVKKLKAEMSECASTCEELGTSVQAVIVETKEDKDGDVVMEGVNDDLMGEGENQKGNNRVSVDAIEGMRESGKRGNLEEADKKLDQRNAEITASPEKEEVGVANDDLTTTVTAAPTTGAGTGSETIPTKCKQQTAREGLYRELFTTSPSTSTLSSKNQARISNGPLNSDVLEENKGNVKPAIHPPTSALYICNFMRPLQPSQLKEHLVRLAKGSSGGKIDGHENDEGDRKGLIKVEDDQADTTLIKFYLDPIRSHALVSFRSTTEASRVRNGLHDRVWPVERGRKSLWVDFIPDDKIDEWIERERVNQRTGVRGASLMQRWEVYYERDDQGKVNVRHRKIPEAASNGHTSVWEGNDGDVNNVTRSHGKSMSGMGDGNYKCEREENGTRKRTNDGRDMDSQNGNGDIITGKSDHGTESVQGDEKKVKRENPTSMGFVALDALFKSTCQAKPKLYFLPVKKELAERRLTSIKSSVSKRWRDELSNNPNYCKDLSQYSFEGEEFVMIEKIIPRMKNREHRGGRERDFERERERERDRDRDRDRDRGMYNERGAYDSFRGNNVRRHEPMRAWR